MGLHLSGSEGLGLGMVELGIHGYRHTVSGRVRLKLLGGQETGSGKHISAEGGFKRLLLKRVSRSGEFKG